MKGFDGPSIGRRVSNYRRINRWSMEELAERTGGSVGKSVIANLETGRKQDLTVSQMVELADALGVSPPALLFDLESIAVGEVGAESDRLSWITGMHGLRDPGPNMTPNTHFVDQILYDYQQLLREVKFLEQIYWLREKSPDDPYASDKSLRSQIDMVFSLREMLNRSTSALRFELLRDRLGARRPDRRREEGRDNAATADPAE